MEKTNSRGSIIIIAMLYFIFGFVTWINAILIPYFKICCELSNFQSYLVTFAFYISYLVMSLPAAFLLRKMGFKNSMTVGFWIMSIGALIFVPAAITRTYSLFLMGLFTIGTGLALLQTAANPYVTILGPKERTAQRFSIMGVFNKLAGVIAPLLFAAVILKDTDHAVLNHIKEMPQAQRDAILNELIRRVIVPYACVGVVLIGLGFFVRYSALPEIDTEHESADIIEANQGKDHIFHFPHLILGALAIFLHVGSQVIAVDTVIGYARSMNMSLLEAKSFPSYTLSATIIGYLLGILFIPRLISQLRALQICTVLGICFTIAIVFTHGEVHVLGHTADISIWFVVLLGFANSMIWAGIWPLALDGLGRFIKIGSSILIMGLCGNAILPLIYGYFADRSDLRSAYYILLPCYAYLFFYACRGYRIKNWYNSKPVQQILIINNNSNEAVS